MADIDKWSTDQIILNGDLINRGPRSLECLQLIQDRSEQENWHLLRGNHEDFVLDCIANPVWKNSIEAQFRRFTDWTVQQLEGQASWLESWSDTVSIQAPDDSSLCARHGSLLGNRDGVHQDHNEQELKKRIPSNCSLFLTAHTHKPMLQIYGETLVANSCSVGSPFDGDRRAAYLRVQDDERGWKVNLARVEYDYHVALNDFLETGFVNAAGAMAKLFHAELITASHLTKSWHIQFDQDIRMGRINLDKAVEIFLNQTRIKFGL